MSIENKASGVAIFFGNTVLLAKRSKNCYITGEPAPFGGYWSIFAGSLEKGEKHQECAVREALEEANSKLDPYNIEKELQASLPKLLPKSYKPEVKYRLTKSSVYAEIDGDKSKQLLRIYVMGSELKLQVPKVVSGSITLDRTSDIASYGKDICARANTLIPKEKKA